MDIQRQGVGPASAFGICEEFTGIDRFANNRKQEGVIGDWNLQPITFGRVLVQCLSGEGCKRGSFLRPGLGPASIFVSFYFFE